MNDNRPRGMSQLDYLWTNYGKASLSNTVSNIPSDEIILTESAVISYLNDVISRLNTDFKLESTEEGNKVCITIKDNTGTVIDKTCFDKGSQITKFEKFIATQEDVDKGFSKKVGNLCLTLQDSIGQKYFIELPEIKYEGQETDSIITAVVGNKVASSLKINNPVLERSVDIKSTTDGIRADLVVDGESSGSITISKGPNGISCHYKWEDEENEIKLKALTSSEYYLLKSIDNGTLYFITDLPCIYFRKIKYASSTSLSEYITRDEAKSLLNRQEQTFNKKIDEVKATQLEAKSYIDSNRENIKALQSTISKLEGDGEGSIIDTINTQIEIYNNNLWWEETL